MDASIAILLATSMRKAAVQKLQIYSLTASEKGWTNNEIALEWLTDHFELFTYVKAQGKTRVLILDRHFSHLTLTFLQYAITYNIIILIYPPHCTHALQGLDVMCFAKMKCIWQDIVTKFEQENYHRVQKDDFIGLFGAVYIWAFDDATVKAAFAKTGVWPFNCVAISAQQMKPSEYTSTSMTFQVPMNSPVHHVITSYQVTTYREGASGSCGTEADIESYSPKWTLSDDNKYDPTSPQTPTWKCAHTLHTSLLHSTSSWHLISGSLYNGTEEIPSPFLVKPLPFPSPDWSLLHTNKQGFEDRDTLVRALFQAKEHIQYLQNAIVMQEEKRRKEKEGKKMQKERQKAKKLTKLAWTHAWQEFKAEH